MSGIIGSYHNIRGSGVVNKLGTDGQVFTSTGVGGAAGFEDAAGGGGKVGQVVSTAKTDTTSTTSTTYADVSGMSVANTCAATSSKVLVLVMAQGSLNDGGLSFKVIRDSTDILIGDADGDRARGVFGGTSYLQSHMQGFNYSFLDSPSSTSEVTYKLQWLTQSAKTNYMNRASYDSDLVYYTRGASTITAMEILA